MLTIINHCYQQLPKVWLAMQSASYYPSRTTKGQHSGWNIIYDHRTGPDNYVFTNSHFLYHSRSDPDRRELTYHDSTAQRRVRPNAAETPNFNIVVRHGARVDYSKWPNVGARPDNRTCHHYSSRTEARR
jgi:hypothetical protein